MNKRYLRTFWFAVIIIASAAVPAQDHNIRLNILRQDDVAIRRMVVIKKSNERISNFVKIDSYDPTEALFVMEDPTGETTRIPVSEIQKFEFEQSVRQQAPMAQEGPWEIRATIGSGSKYEVGKDKLRVEFGDLVVPVSSPSTSIPAPTVAPQPSAHHGGTLAVSKVLEARTLTVANSKSFVILVHSVIYTTERWGSLQPSGVVK